MISRHSKNVRKVFSFEVPCPLRTWSIKDLHKFLYFEALSSVFFFTIPPIPYCAIYMHKFVSFFSIFGLVSIKFVNPSILIICSRNVNSFFLILSILYLKLLRCLHAPSVLFSASFCWTIFLLPQVSFSARNLSRIH